MACTCYWYGEVVCSTTVEIDDKTILKTIVGLKHGNLYFINLLSKSWLKCMACTYFEFHPPTKINIPYLVSGLQTLDNCQNNYSQLDFFQDNLKDNYS